MTASWACGPSGSVSLIGTGTVVHWAVGRYASVTKLSHFPQVVVAVLCPAPGAAAAGTTVARPIADQGLELAGSRLGIVGVGAVGSRLAAVAAGLGMQVFGLTRRPETLPGGVTAADKKTLFAESDVVVLSCPLTDQTRGLVDAATLASMKPTAVLINAARGPVVDAQALVAALRAGTLAGAALDVHDKQPLTGDEAVFDCPNLLLTPHVAAITATSMHAMSRGAVDTLLALLRGERPSNVVNSEVFQR